jgi:hypothetical protein
MADTKHGHAAPAHDIPVEGDGISYSGLGWFVVVLTVTTVLCQLLVWGLFEVMENRAESMDAARAPLALPAGTLPPGPTLLADEPANLRDFRQAEQDRLTTYGWVDRNGGRVRLPIERAKALVIERGLPVRDPR